MATITTSKLVWELMEAGHEVEWVDPKNGTLRITRIDGKRFGHASSAGNKLAREMLGYKLTPGQEKAIRKAAQTHRRRYKESLGRPLTQRQKRELRKLRKAYKKSTDLSGKEWKRITEKRARQIKKEQGWKGFKEGLKKRIFEGWVSKDDLSGILTWIHDVWGVSIEVEMGEDDMVSSQAFNELHAIWYSNAKKGIISVREAVNASVRALKESRDAFGDFKKEFGDLLEGI